MSPQFLRVPHGQFPNNLSLAPSSDAPSPEKEMISGKSCPIAVEIGGILYVLAGPPTWYDPQYQAVVSSTGHSYPRETQQILQRVGVCCYWDNGLCIIGKGLCCL